MSTRVAPSAPVGDFKASVIESARLMVRMQRRRTLRNLLSAPVDMNAWKGGITEYETEHGMPVVQITDLMKQKGDRVTCDILDRVGGEPVMGDDIAENKGEDMTILRDEVKIDQARKVINVGGRMSQQRNPHAMRGKGQGLAVQYLHDLEDNMVQVHMAGARGYDVGQPWKMPLESSPNFERIAVNPVLPPALSRYVGITPSITSPADIDPTNTLTFNFFDDLRTIMDSDEVPLQGISMSSMDGKKLLQGENSPLLICYISSEQFNQLLKESSDQSVRRYQADATARLAEFQSPLFRNGQCLLIRDIIICQSPRPILFPEGSNVRHYNVNGGIDVVQAGTRSHRGVVMGAQALACAYGSAERWDGSDSGTRGSGRTSQKIPYSWVEKLRDGDNQLQLFIGMLNGVKKLRYKFDGRTVDNGIFTFDSAVPALR